MQPRPEQLKVKFAVGAWLGTVTVTDFVVIVLCAPWLSVTRRPTL